ncbi:MAG: calcium-binding protein [Alphaproteobacteria bacterium]
MFPGFEFIIGTQNDDSLEGGTSHDLILGLGGDDVIFGGEGDDFILGQHGADVIDGGEGDDILAGGVGSDTYVFGPDSGADIVWGFDLAEDTIDLTAAGISSLDGRVSDDTFGNAVIDLGGGNQITVAGVSAADLLGDGTVILAPSGPEEIFLGVNDTYTDAGDFTDQIIDGDSNGEELTDTDTFIFGPGTGNDTITDFQYEDLDPATFDVIPGDVLDLSGYGIFGDDLTDAGFTAWFDSLVTNGLLDGYSVTASDTVLNFTDGSSLTLLGIGESEIGIVIEENMVRDTGGSV